VTLREVAKRFGATRAVEGVSLRVAHSEFLALLGPSGCGKTTLLRLIAGFERVDEGTIHFDDTLVSSRRVHLPPERRRIGMVFQSYALWPHMSVAENVGYALRVRGVGKDARRREVEAALALVGLAGMSGRRPGELSGGQRQRVALARCLAAQPALVLLDEPLANLDVHLRDSMALEFRTFHGRTGATMVYVTHDQAEAMALADRIAVMQDGVMQQVATPEELYRRPRTPMVAEFIGRGMVVPGEALGRSADERVSARLFGVPAELRSEASSQGEVSVCLRPEGLRLVNGTGEPAIDARVERTTFQGDATTVYVRPDHEAAAVLYLRVAGAAPAPGALVRIAVDDGWIIPDR
jgi:iron(III) transport system ATP-binding protein